MIRYLLFLNFRNCVPKEGAKRSISRDRLRSPIWRRELVVLAKLARAYSTSSKSLEFEKRKRKF